MIIILTKLVYHTSPMPHTKSQDHRPPGSGEEYFKVFLTYMDMAITLVMGPKLFVQTFVPAPEEVSI